MVDDKSSESEYEDEEGESEQDEDFKTQTLRDSNNTKG